MPYFVTFELRSVPSLQAAVEAASLIQVADGIVESVTITGPAKIELVVEPPLRPLPGAFAPLVSALEGITFESIHHLDKDLTESKRGKHRVVCSCGWRSKRWCVDPFRSLQGHRRRLLKDM